MIVSKFALISGEGVVARRQRATRELRTGFPFCRNELNAVTKRGHFARNRLTGNYCGARNAAGALKPKPKLFAHGLPETAVSANP